MTTKQQITKDLDDIFHRWQELLDKLTDAQLKQPLSPSAWTIKDVVAHMWCWQQASVARMEAALAGKEPAYPDWWERFAPDPEEDVDRTNAWNYERNRDKPWQQVYNDWYSQFTRYLELVRQVPENDLLELGRFKWMGRYPLSASSMGSCDHHREHYKTVTGWLKQHPSNPDV